jgi:predicted GTPase
MNINTSPEAKVFMQNKLARARRRLSEVGPLVESKKREVESLEGLREAYVANRSLGDPDEVLDSLFESERNLVLCEDDKAMLETEIDVLVSALGGSLPCVVFGGGRKSLSSFFFRL